MRVKIYDSNDILILNIKLDDKTRLRTRILKIIKRPLTESEYRVIEKSLTLLKKTCFE